MVTYPIYVKRDGYSGRDPRKMEKRRDYNRCAAELEQHINGLLENQVAPIQTYLYHQIAAATGYPLETVRDVCFSIDCGHNGFTAVKKGMTYEQAIAAAEMGGQNAGD